MDNNPEPTLSSLSDAKGFHKSDPRTREAGFYPGFAKGRATAVVSRFNTLGPSAVTIANGQYATQTYTTSANNNRDIIATFVEWGVFVGTQNTQHSLIPFYLNNTVIDLTQWQVLGPFKSILSSVDGSSGATNARGVASDRLTILNISAGTVTLYFYATIKYVLNYGNIGGVA